MRFSAHSLRPMGGRGAPLTCARTAPVPGGHVCVAYERCVPHESDSCHSGHAPASGAARQGYAAANAAIRGRWPRAGQRATPKGRAGFLNGAGVPRQPSRSAFWTVLPETFCAAAARDRGFAAGRQVFGAPDMARQDFLAPCMVIASVWHDTGIWRARCRTTGTEGKGACVGQQGQDDGGGSWRSNGACPRTAAITVREPGRCAGPVLGHAM
jgi:hypothetical protein